eukprot:RCo046036
MRSCLSSTWGAALAVVLAWLYHCPAEAYTCIATTAPTHYATDCPAGSTCSPISCATGSFPSPSYMTPYASCNADGASWTYHYCDIACIATSAPTGYVGDCAAGQSCTGISCASGYYPFPYWASASTHCSQTAGDPFTYQYCGLGCAATPAPLGYVGDCPAGQDTCTAVTCASGFYNLNPSYAAPQARCHNMNSDYLPGDAYEYINCVASCTTFDCPSSLNLVKRSGTVYCATATCTYAECCTAAASLSCTQPSLPAGYVDFVSTTCATGYHGTALAVCASNGGTLQLFGCTVNQCYFPPSAAAPGYSPGPSCSSTGALTSECPGTQCASGYHGTPVLTCPFTYPGAYRLSGCTANQCTLSTIPSLYTARSGSCSSLTTVEDCQPRLSCAAGAVGTPTLQCTTNGGTFTLSGCTDPALTCTLPNPLTTGYSYRGSGCAGQLLPASCTGLSCATGYTGSVTLSCASSGATFTLSGCNANTCTLPSPITTGYTATSCSGQITAASCSVSCDSGYTGT